MSDTTATSKSGRWTVEFDPFKNSVTVQGRNLYEITHDRLQEFLHEMKSMVETDPGLVSKIMNRENPQESCENACELLDTAWTDILTDGMVSGAKNGSVDTDIRLQSPDQEKDYDVTYELRGLSETFTYDSAKGKELYDARKTRYQDKLNKTTYGTATSANHNRTPDDEGTDGENPSSQVEKETVEQAPRQSGPESSEDPDNWI